jgi:Leucine-rich repeat (LRR) protein
MIKRLTTHVKCLNLAKNSLSFVDDLIIFKNLTKLDLSINFLSKVNLDLRKLQSLDLAYNYLSELPDLQFLPNLKKLDVSHNELSCLD